MGHIAVFLSYFLCKSPPRRTLQRQCSAHAFPPLNTFVPQTQEARVFRRAQAVRDVVTGQRLHTVSDTRHCTYAALRTWVSRFANQGPQGRLDRPRSGRPPQVTCARAMPRNRLVDQAPLPHGASSSPGRCRALATVFARETGGQRGRESVRGV
jgi:hypothetical protein